MYVVGCTWVFVFLYLCSVSVWFYGILNSCSLNILTTFCWRCEIIRVGFVENVEKLMHGYDFCVARCCIICQLVSVSSDSTVLKSVSSMCNDVLTVRHKSVYLAISLHFFFFLVCYSQFYMPINAKLKNPIHYMYLA